MFVLVVGRLADVLNILKLLSILKDYELYQS